MRIKNKTMKYINEILFKKWNDWFNINQIKKQG
jgi:hypothetical protein